MAGEGYCLGGAEDKRTKRTEGVEFKGRINEVICMCVCGGGGLEIKVPKWSLIIGMISYPLDKNKR